MNKFVCFPNIFNILTVKDRMVGVYDVVSIEFRAAFRIALYEIRSSFVISHAFEREISRFVLEIMIVCLSSYKKLIKFKIFLTHLLGLAFLGQRKANVVPTENSCSSKLLLRNSMIFSCEKVHFT